jgi:hypothetical protein
MSMEHRWMILTWENPSTWRKTWPSATLSITNPTWIGLVLNQHLLHDTPGTKYLNHLKCGSVKVNRLTMTFWVHIHCYKAHTAMRTHFNEPKVLPCCHTFECGSILAACNMRPTGQTLFDPGVQPNWNFQQKHFYLVTQHKCTSRPVGPSHLPATSVLLLKYPYCPTANRPYCYQYKNSCNQPDVRIYPHAAHIWRNMDTPTRDPTKKNALVYPV